MKAEIIYFSATGTTRKIANAIAEGLHCETTLSDITLPADRSNYRFGECDLTIMAFPVYGERIPAFLYQFIGMLDGRGSALAGVAVYGNMGYGVVPKQYASYAKTNHFRLIASAAMVGQHTYASGRAPVGLGRPDEADLSQAKAFGLKIRNKMDSGEQDEIPVTECSVPKILTKLPDGGVRRIIRQPSANYASCSACGVCAARCPVGAIDQSTLSIDEGRCLRCYACVQVCPKNARTAAFQLPLFEKIFYAIGKKRKENIFVL